MRAYKVTQGLHCDADASLQPGERQQSKCPLVDVQECIFLGMQKVFAQIWSWKIWFDRWTSPKYFQFITMFLFSHKFDRSFSHLTRFNCSCCTLPKCSYFTQMFLILPKTLSKFFSWLKFDWRLLELPYDSSSLKGSVNVAIRSKKNGKIVWDYFAVLAIILLLIWLLLCLSLENRNYLAYMWM